MPQRKGRGKPQSLSVQEWAEIDRITKEIMTGTELQRPAFARHIKQVLARNITAARKTYDAQAAAEEIHKPNSPDAPFGEHAISACSLNFCGRYAGQRRDSAESVSRQGQALEDFSRYGCLEPPPAPAGPAAYCRACAASGVGVCDDYPDCPGGRGQRIASEPDPGWPPQGS